MEQSKVIVDKINKLIQTNIDREKGYERAIEQADDDQLKGYFQECCNVSAEYILQLKPFVEQYGGVPVEDSSTAGDMYRAWMDLRSGLTANNDKATLKSCEKGEDVAVNAYKEVTSDHDVPLAPHLMQVINEQQAKIQSMHNQIKSLRDSQE